MRDLCVFGGPAQAKKAKPLPHFQSYEMSNDEQKILLSANFEPIYRHSGVADYYIYDRSNSTFTCISLDGKQRLTDVTDKEQLFRIIQSVPSKKAEPIKLWLAQVASERIEQAIDPEKSIDQAIADFRKKGYSEHWINQRIKGIGIRKKLTDTWHDGGIHTNEQFANLTDIITKGWSGMTTREYKQHKGLRKESLRDNMTDVELMLNGLAEAATTEINEKEKPKGFAANAKTAKRGGSVAGVARKKLEKELGRSVVTKDKAIDYIRPKDELPFPKKE